MRKLILALLIFVLLLPFATFAQSEDEAEPELNIIELLAELEIEVEADPDADPAEDEELEPLTFTTLLEAIELAELDAALSEEGPFTLFAPTDAAFEALPPGMLEAVLNSPPSLVGVLSYHVLEGEFLAEDVLEAEMLMSLLGAPLLVTVDEEAEAVFLNENVQIIVTDILATNGVIHVIDAVLIPERPGASDDSAADLGEAPALNTSLWAAVAGPFSIAELDTADDFFVTVVDPFTQNELYGIEIINWVANYPRTTFIIQQGMTAEILIWLNAADSAVFENLDVAVLRLMPAEEVAKLPEEVQALLAE